MSVTVSRKNTPLREYIYCQIIGIYPNVEDPVSGKDKVGVKNESKMVHESL